MNDYAADLLGGGAEAKAEPETTDYASDLLGGAVKMTPGGAVTAIRGRGMPRNPAQAAEHEGLTADDLEVANAEAGVTDKTTADFATMTKAAMVDDPATKLRIFANARFPKDPNAIERYGILPDGEVIYVGDDDKLYRETPKGYLMGAKEFAAGLTGALPEIAGGAAGAAAGAPAGPAASIALAALGAAGGKGYGKTIANIAFDEPQTVSGNIGSMTKEAVFGAGGELFGQGVIKWLNRRAARDIAKLDRPASDALLAKARAQGIDLNPAQSTNLPSIKGKYDALATHPQSRDIIAEGAKRQADQAEQAAERFLRGVSPVEGLDEAGTRARDAAKKVIAELTKERAQQANPLYRRAFSEFEEFSDDLAARLAKLRTSPSFRDAERIAKRLYEDDLAVMKPGEMPMASALRDLHYTKLALDKLIGDAATGGYQKTSRKALIGLKNELLDVMDSASPAYRQARQTFAHLTPNIESVEDGVISRIAGLGDEQAMKAAQTMFNPGMSPAAVERARNLFEKAGLKQDWDAMIRAHLAETFEQSGRRFATTGGNPLSRVTKWEAELVGNPRQYRLLQKAMTPQQFQGFNDLMEVLSAMGRTAQAGAGSQTAGRLEALKQLGRESGAGVMGQTAALTNPLSWGPRFMQWRAEVRLGNHAEKLAEIMTSPEGQKQLRELTKLSPDSEEFIAKASAIFGISLSPRSRQTRQQQQENAQ